jgi:SAM-dependent methyltransferase
MPFSITDIINAQKELTKFKLKNKEFRHERFIFPFLCGSYFTYRNIDVVRIATICKTISNNPTYLDVGCGYGDFLEKIREYIPNAEGIEKSAEIFYCLGKIKPNYIHIGDAYHDINKKYDVIFVGWMEPGVDYREAISTKSDVIITTLDQGISLAAEFDGHGFERIASWITPSWIDVNTEIMNKYYTAIPENILKKLADLRGAHNLWYVYCKPHLKNLLRNTFLSIIKDEKDEKDELEDGNLKRKYEHEKIFDECGFEFNEPIPSNPTQCLWKISLE